MISQRKSVLELICLLLTAALMLGSCGLIIINRPEETTEAAESGVNTSAETSVQPVTREPGTPVETEDSLSKAKNLVAALPKRDFEGIGVTIAVTDETVVIPSDSEQPSYVSEIRRNQMVEEKYNTIIMTELSANDAAMLRALKTALNSGDYYADLLCIPYGSLGSFAADGALMNMNTLPFTDYTAAYYNTDAVKQMSAGYMTYAVSGAFNESIESFSAIFFNRELLGDASSSLYVSAASGDWTWAKLLEYAASASSDIDGVSGFIAQEDADTVIDTVFLSSSQHYFSAGTGKIPTRSFNNQRSESVVETARALLYGDLISDASGESNAVSVFYDGSAAFLLARLYTLTWLTDMPENWGLLPVPKINETQSYYCSPAAQGTTVVAVPASSVRLENIGLVLQALNAASYGCIYDASFTSYINNNLRDNGSVNMLTLVTQNLRFDFAYIFGSGYSSVPNSSYMLLRAAVKNGYAIARYYDDYTAGVERQMNSSFAMY